MAAEISVASPESLRIRTLLARAAGQNVLIVGAGVTGRAVAKLLCGAKFRVTVIDQKKTAPEIREELEKRGARLIDSFSPDQTWLRGEEFKFAILSPGVSMAASISEAIAHAGIPRVSEIDLGVAFLGMPEVAVTGTNGKTTTVHLIQQMLTASGLEAELVGNVGYPFVNLIQPDELQERKQSGAKRLLVAEVSSYQLESAVDFTPHIGVWLNIDDDHLERHGSIEEYLRIKARMFSGQSKDRDWSIIFADDRYSAKMRQLARGRYLPFGLAKEGTEAEPNGCFYSLPEEHTEERIVLRINNIDEQYSLQGWTLLGLHNRYNLCAAIAAARLAGAKQEAIQQSISTFRGLEHRLELVKVVRGVSYVNDSKATNVSATCAAIDTIRSEYGKSEIILLVGGQAKEGSFEPLRAQLFRGVKATLIFGSSRDVLYQEMQSGCKTCVLEKYETLEAATKRTQQIASPGDVVLLAPACASFDAFQSYAHRGERFRELVAGL